MEESNIRNFINSSSLGVYTKYIKIVDGQKYLVKSGRSDGKSKSSILELFKHRIEEAKRCLFQNQN
ncbi:hypothetical protein FDB34_14360 [Clostridium botulinum]|nr:hypothetical protein [Clostridium botulinum]